MPKASELTIDTDIHDDSDSDGESASTPPDRHTALCDAVVRWASTHLASDTGNSGCPYSKSIVERGGFSVLVGQTVPDELPRLKAIDPPIPPGALLGIWTNPTPGSYAPTMAFVAEQNRNHMGTWLTAFHPDDPDIERIPGSDILTVNRICVFKLAPLSGYASLPPQLVEGGRYANMPPRPLADVKARSAALSGFRRAYAHGFCDHDEIAIHAHYHKRLT